MSRRFVLWCGAVAATVILPACSLLFDGSAYRGGVGGDGGMTDADLPDGSAPGECDAARIAECEAAGPFCDPATGACVATCSDAICAARDAATPICDAAGTTCVRCREDATCGATGICEAGTCVECDTDGDGFASGEGRCTTVRPRLPRDCAPGNPAIFPGALPICDDGIDQSCSGGSIAGGLATELGRYPAIEIGLPPSTDRPSRLRVFLTGSNRALVVLAAGNADRTVTIADVNLMTGAILESGPLLEIVGMPEPVLVQSDAIRLPNGNVVVSMLETDPISARIRRVEYDVITRDWSFTVLDTDFGGETEGFNQFGDAALIRRADGQEFVVTGARTTAEPNPRLFAFRVDMPFALPIAPASVVTATRPWIESSGNAAVFASPDGSVRFWRGNTTGTGDLTLVGGSIPSGVASTAATLAVRGSSIENRIAFLAPTASRIEAFTASCTSSASLADCSTFAPGPDSPASYPLENLAEPVIAATRVSSTALIVATSRASVDGPELGFLVVETGPLSGAPLELPVSVPVNGTPRDVAVDAEITPEAVGEMQGELNLASVYLEEEGPRRTVFLVGARGCIGYGGI